MTLYHTNWYNSSVLYDLVNILIFAQYGGLIFVFYDQVKSLCKTRNIAISTLARTLNLSPSAPNNWKEGTLPKAETIMKLSDFFNVSTDFLLYGEDRHSNSASQVFGGAAVIQSSNGNSVSVSNQASEANGLEGFEAELVRIYRALNMKDKSALIQAAYDLEEKAGN